MTQPASTAQIRAIHSLSRTAGLDEDARRDVMARQANGKRSSRELTIVEAIKVIDHLQTLVGVRDAKPKAHGAMELDGDYVAPARALWISGFHLGVIEDRTDRAMVAFVRRQTKIDHLNWVKDARDGARVLEGLKAWLARTAGVDWAAEEQSGRGRKMAVYLALRRLLTAAGVDSGFVEFPGRVGVRHLADNALDHLTRAGGERLRAAKAG